MSGYPQQFAKRFLKTLDFTKLYKLKPDPVKTDADLLERDSDHRYRLGPPTLTRLYEDTRGLILIPQVPESVRRTFGLAKQLHTYAYFEDYFYTVSAHYAYLAVEAGVHARWSESLPQNVTLQYRDDRYDVLSPVHQHIADIAHERRWKREKVLVNGQPFPYSTRLLLNWMVAERIIGKWIRRRLEIAIHMRNAYSHLERAPVAWSCMADLHAASELINIMFHSLPSDKYEE
ncbi:MAG TPA: hypothetical protein VE422_28575 [Terriglobia bacterium]|nr:hypothetical protein [Terriglobia bacterium]